jgi:hypothetical protein
LFLDLLLHVVDTAAYEVSWEGRSDVFDVRAKYVRAKYDMPGGCYAMKLVIVSGLFFGVS